MDKISISLQNLGCNRSTIDVHYNLVLPIHSKIATELYIYIYMYIYLNTIKSNLDRNFNHKVKFTMS